MFRVREKGGGSYLAAIADAIVDLEQIVVARRERDGRYILWMQNGTVEFAGAEADVAERDMHLAVKEKRADQI